MNWRGASITKNDYYLFITYLTKSLIFLLICQWVLLGQNSTQKKGNIFVLLYPDCVLGEITKTCLELDRDYNIITVSLDEPVMIKTLEGLTILPDKRLESSDSDKMSCLVIPGGYPDRIYHHPRWPEFSTFLQALNNDGIIIGGICGGVFPLIASGILNNRSFTGDSTDFKNHQTLIQKSNFLTVDVVVSGNIVTAQSYSDLEFAIELGKQLGIYTIENDVKELIDFYRKQDPEIYRE